MTLDDDTLRTTLRSIHSELTTEEAHAILDVARLAAAIDKRSNVGEMLVLLSINRILSELTGKHELELSSASIDADRLLDIGEHLVPIGARELAFACAFLVMIQDLDLTAEESKLAEMLGDALVLDPARASELAKQMEAMARAARG